MKKIAPSILSADLANLSQQIRYVEIGGADWIHCDIMDGMFVPNITFGPLVVKSINRVTDLPMDVHLMIKDPDRYLVDFVKSGADIITVHQEEVVHLNRTISAIKKLGAKAGVAINPSTPINVLTEILNIADLILVMSVNPGFGGQSFIESSIQKIKDLNAIRKQYDYGFMIEVDGGINNKTIKKVSDAGCDVFVAGSSIFSSSNISGATVELKNLVTQTLV